MPVQKQAQWFRCVFDVTLLKFFLVGVVNTMVGTLVMFAAYNLLQFDYWTSTALNYLLSSVLSYCLNKHITFRDKSCGVRTAVKFSVNIVVCYTIAYGIAKPLTDCLLSGAEKTVQDNGAMLVGLCLFAVMNYLGQRFFTFKE